LAQNLGIELLSSPIWGITVTEKQTAQAEDSPSGEVSQPVPGWHLHRRLYDWVIHFSNTKHGGTALFCLSFAESSFFPIPPDVLLGPLALGAPKKWFRFALACSCASVLGGILGYLIGAFFWEAIHEWAFANFAWAKITPENFTSFAGYYERLGFWIVFACGFTPLPYKVCTISAGVAGISFPGFLIASTLSRSARFFLVAGLMGWKGERIRPLIERYFNWLSLAFVVLLIGGFYALNLIH